MAHGITSKDKFAYQGEKPWHHLGNDLTENPPKTVEEILQVGGLNFWVTKVPTGFMKDGEFVADGRFDVVREDDMSVLGHGMTAAYEVVQASEVFGQVLQPYLDSHLLTWETAGTLFGGRKFFVVAKINRGSFEIVPGDQVDGYMMWAASHDGSMSVTMGYTGIRVVCANTLRAAIGSRDSRLLKVKHTKGATEAIAAANESIDLASRGWAMRVDAMRTLAKVAVNKAQVDAYIRKVFEINPEKDSDGNLSGNGTRIIQRAEDLVESAMGMEIPGVRGTAWGLFNAVTQYLSHEAARAKDLGSKAARSNLMDSNLLGGQGGARIERALREAVLLAKDPKGYASTLKLVA